VELAAAFGTSQSGGVIVAAISAVFTMGYVANLLGEDEDWLFELSIEMFPEDGCLWVYGIGEGDRGGGVVEDLVEIVGPVDVERRVAVGLEEADEGADQHLAALALDQRGPGIGGERHRLPQAAGPEAYAVMAWLAVAHAE
jgi:hypothetical protein